ncbi:MAG TPA: BamA/TamA family outer membrane protein [Polyangiaceae bacterium]|nr:BamA/TamA family outer membrane protein [Polyangiaceae bacterium]
MKKYLAALLAGLSLGFATSEARAGDPRLEWYTLQTPHFRINFHGGLEPLAQRLAGIAERSYAILAPNLDYYPTEVIEVIFTDDAELANGSAGAVPYSTVQLFATAPDDMSALGDYDDWLTQLVTHELTHVLHVDNVSGLPALLNKILGKTAIPNQSQPRWILEGLATTMETDHTTGGRLRSTQFDMYLRADVLEDNFARLDQMSGIPRRWPGATVWYLYGSSFVSFISQTYGPNVFAAVADDYGAQVFPWAVNRSVRRVTGRTYEELYQGWHASLKERYTRQAQRIRARGLREGNRLTRHGNGAGPAVFTSNCGTLGRPSVIYQRDDGHGQGGFYEVSLDGSDPQGKLRARAGGQQLSFLPDCSFLFDDSATSEHRYAFLDLFRQLPGTSSREQDHTRSRLTRGARARHPDVSRDGRRVAFVTNDRSTSTLRIAELDAAQQLVDVRRLVPSARFEQAYTPRFSPDGRKLAYSAWTAGGYRDIRIVDVATGKFQELFHDRAIDQQPVFSPDGKRLYFVSDRTGVANVYVYELESAKLWQVTNVINGAYHPTLSADEKTLVYTGYTSAGWDLFVLDNQRQRWLEPEPYRVARGKPVPSVAPVRYPVSRYTALPSLRPRRYYVEYGPGSFGNQLTFSSSGRDIVGLHGVSAAIGIPTDFERGEAQFSLDYAYYGLPFYFQLSGFRSSTPRSDYRYSDRQPPIVEHLTGVTTGLSFGAPGSYESQYFSLSYTVAEFSQRLPLGLPDPYAPLPSEPHRGLLGLLHLGYHYSQSEASTYAISQERGFQLSVGTDLADRVLGSETSLASFSATLTGYLSVPGLKHHVLAVALSGGTGGGTYPRRGLFSIGGYSDIPLYDSFTMNLRQSGIRLRGYEPGQFIGNDYNLVNLEYRLPLWYADRGLSTLPGFLRTVAGAAFLDWGAAYNQLDLDDPLKDFHEGVGAELWFELLFGYYVSGNVRLGIAKGLDAEAPSGIQTYSVVSAAF